jgi:hypothetical protein
MSQQKIDKLQIKLGNLHNTLIRTVGKIDDLLIGKEATILSDYNGQPFGRSRPSMKGKRIVIADVAVSHTEIEVRPRGQRLYLPLAEVEVHW